MEKVLDAASKKEVIAMSDYATFSFNLNLHVPIGIAENVPCHVSVSFGQPYLTYPEELKLVQVPPPLQRMYEYPQDNYKDLYKERTTKEKKANNLDLNWSEDGF